MWAVILGGAGGCYTNPINRVPTVSIEPVGDVFRGQPAAFMAIASDPDGDPLTLSWAVGAPVRVGVCPDVQDQATWPPPDASGPPEIERIYKPTAPDKAFCVWAFAKDNHGAVTPFNLHVTPGNHPPTAVITLTSPDLAGSYQLYTNFVLKADASDPEGDPITYAWSLTAPSGHPNTFGFCDDAESDDKRCFVADVPGRYVGSLVVADDQDAPATRAPPATITLDVLPDRLPCIAMTDPPFGSFWDGDPSQDATFTVTRVDDDGDQRDIHFKWFYARPNEPWTFVDIDFPQLNIKADSFQVGDMGQVRVEIRDRANQTAIDNALLGCGDDPVCAAQGNPGCFQRVTWTVQWSL